MLWMFVCIAEYRNVKCARVSFCIVFAMTWLKLKLHIELMNGFGRSKVEFCPTCICYRRVQIFIKTAGPTRKSLHDDRSETTDIDTRCPVTFGIRNIEIRCCHTPNAVKLNLLCATAILCYDY